MHNNNIRNVHMNNIVHIGTVGTMDNNDMIPINMRNVPMLEKEDDHEHDQEIDTVSTFATSESSNGQTHHHNRNEDESEAEAESDQHRNTSSSTPQQSPNHNEQQRNVSNIPNVKVGNITIVYGKNDMVYLYTNNNNKKGSVDNTCMNSTNHKNGNANNSARTEQNLNLRSMMNEENKGLREEPEKEDEEMTITPSMNHSIGSKVSENKTDGKVVTMHSGNPRLMNVVNHKQNNHIVHANQHGSESMRRLTSGGYNVLGCNNQCNTSRNICKPPYQRQLRHQQANGDQVMRDKTRKIQNVEISRDIFRRTDQSLGCPLCKGSAFVNQTTLLSHLKRRHNILFQ